MKIVVTGMIATYPVGGVAWDYGQYALGLEKMGFTVYYLEDTGAETYDPDKGLYGEDCSYGVKFLEETMARFSPSLARRWHFRAPDGLSYGMPREEMLQAVREADLFLNVSNSCLLREEYMSCRKKAMLDTDPGWNHFVNFPKADKNPGWQGSRSWRKHDFFFTYAEQIGKSKCLLPDLGIPWRTTRPPVVLDAWRSETPGKTWTTVMTWNNFRKPIEHDGVLYGTKEMEFGKIEELPRKSAAAFEVASGGSGVPAEHWRAIGWSVVDSHGVSRTPEDYRSYIQKSRGELSVAKNVYVAAHSGWFSCRSVCYLAAGRPVVVQDTGFSEIISSGAGLHAFTDEAGALAAVEAVEKDYETHSKAAKESAREFFAAEKILGRMLEDMA